MSDNQPQKPDPSDIEKLDTDAYVYERDSNGELLPESDVIEVDGSWERIERQPPTKGLLSRIQEEFEGREDVNIDELDDVMHDFYVHPDVDDWDDVNPSLYVALMNHMVQVVGGEMGDDVADEIESELEERREGNQTSAA